MVCSITAEFGGTRPRTTGFLLSHASDKIGLADQIGRPDGTGTKPEVRNGDRARLLGIVDEVALGVVVGVLANNLDSHKLKVQKKGATDACPPAGGDADQHR